MKPGAALLLSSISLLCVQCVGGQNLPGDPWQMADMAEVTEPIAGRYRLSGDQAVRPAEVIDDGRKTYIRWLDEQAMPAVFGIGPSGDEEMVEGHMRDGVFTIDRVYGRLIFRIDKAKATARRVAERSWN